AGVLVPAGRRCAAERAARRSGERDGRSGARRGAARRAAACIGAGRAVTLRILGLSTYHADAAAAAVADGCFVAGAEEERFRRVKHWAGFPAEALRWAAG